MSSTGLFSFTFAASAAAVGRLLGHRRGNAKDESMSGLAFTLIAHDDNSNDDDDNDNNNDDDNNKVRMLCSYQLPPTTYPRISFVPLLGYVLHLFYLFLAFPLILSHFLHLHLSHCLPFPFTVSYLFPLVYLSLTHHINLTSSFFLLFNFILFSKLLILSSISCQVLSVPKTLFHVIWRKNCCNCFSPPT